MNCGENNKTVIVKVEAIPTSGVDLSKYNYLASQAPLVSDSYGLNSGVTPMRLFMDPSTAELSSTMQIERGGRKYKCVLEYDLDLPAEDASDELTQISQLKQGAWCLLVTYMGDTQSFIFAPDNCMLFETEQKSGKVHCTITIENLTDIEPFKYS